MSFFDDLFEVLASLSSHHKPQSPLWKILNEAASQAVEEAFSSADAVKSSFGPFGQLAFPYVEMGAINSKHLFGMDELILFAYYHANRHHYSKVVDFGANIGLHSIMMSRAGFDVRAFEPDDYHAQLHNKNTKLNDVTPDLHRSAIGLEDGTLDFVRVLGNTTGSHIKGAKKDPYGELETFSVAVEAAEPHLRWADFAKIDIEGLEATLISGLPKDIWLSTDAMMEVGTAENAAVIFDYLHASDVNMFSQKTNWSKVEKVEDLPTSHREGSLFLTGKESMHWGE